MKRLFLLLAVISLAAVVPLSGASAGSVLNVPADYPTIQAAIDAASGGDTVLVAPGEYVESIELKSGVTVQSAEGAEVTTIRGDGSWLWRPGEGYTYTVFGAGDSTISGFTITGSLWGIINYHLSSPSTITNNIITGNGTGFPYNIGAGVYNWYASTTIANNVISDNQGYGISNDFSSATITSNRISGSTAGIGHWYASSTITNNIITDCGGGIYEAFYYPSTITNNTIVGCHYYGIYIQSDSIVTNNIIAGNGGNGIYIYTPNHQGYSTSPTITYNNIWGNGGADIADHGTNTTLANNISANPIFADPVAGDYRLQEGSPCIDAGTNDATGLPETDLDGNSRIADDDGDGIAVVDMGALEGSVERGCRRVPEIEITSFGPDYLWPPTRKLEEITVTGRVFDKKILLGGCPLLGAGFSVDDEYGVHSSEGGLTVDADGNFTLTLQVEAWRDGDDFDGRHYRINLFAEDEAGTASKNLEVLVPHHPTVK